MINKSKTWKKFRIIKGNKNKNLKEIQILFCLKKGLKFKRNFLINLLKIINKKNLTWIEDKLKMKIRANLQWIKIRSYSLVVIDFLRLQVQVHPKGKQVLQIREKVLLILVETMTLKIYIIFLKKTLKKFFLNTQLMKVGNKTFNDMFNSYYI